MPSLDEHFGGATLLKGKDSLAPSSLKDHDIVGIYFSAHWCPPCRGFTPVLAKLYKKLTEEGKKFEIVFASADHNEKEFKEYYGTMPWASLPFGHKSIEELNKTFKVNGIPTLVLLDGKGEVINKDGRDAIGSDPEGKKYPWKPPTFFEALGKTFTSKEGSVTFDSHVKGKTIGLYFSASWCGPCRQFTPKLIETYKKLKAKRDDFEIIFCSSDKDLSQFTGYYDHMPWLALPFAERDRKEDLSSLFGVKGIPCFVLVGSDGVIINKDGRNNVDADPEGNEFPWYPKVLNDLKSTAAGLNELPCLTMLLDEADEVTTVSMIEALRPVAEEYSAKLKAEKRESDLCFFYATEKGGIVDQIRGLTNSSPFTLVIVDIADNGGYYVNENFDHTTDSIRQWVADFKAGKLERRQMEG